MQFRRSLSRPASPPLAAPLAIARPAPALVAPPPRAATEPASAPPPARLELTARPPARADRPLYKKGWFWGAVGGGAALVAAAVIVGVLVGTSGGDSPRTLPDLRY